MLFASNGEIVGSHQLEHNQIYPKPAWVEHDPIELWDRSCMAIRQTLRQTDISSGQMCAIGISNQRETTVVWDPTTGKPWCNAIVWQDARTADFVAQLSSKGGVDRFREQTGLPLATYFSGSKIRWILENVAGVREAALSGRAIFGTVDSWLIWNFTGGTAGGRHITDITNASRTMLMNINTGRWDEEMLAQFQIPEQMLPLICPSIPDEPYGYTTKEGPFGERIALCGILGDQQAALFGQACFEAGSSKNTYGTGCFLLMNTGQVPVKSEYGLITTVAYQRGQQKPLYALEGSIAVAGSLVQWMRDNFGLIERSSDIELLASQVADNGGVYFVPAFSGLFAPHWRADARGVITGLTGYASAGHLARAVLESTAFQTWEIVQSMAKDCDTQIEALRVDGGMVANDLLMQFQSDILAVPVIRPKIAETTALGVAYAAGLSAGFWSDMADLKSHWQEDKLWSPRMPESERQKRLAYWKKAIARSLDWQE